MLDDWLIDVSILLFIHFSNYYFFVHSFNVSLNHQGSPKRPYTRLCPFVGRSVGLTPVDWANQSGSFVTESSPFFSCGHAILLEVLSVRPSEKWKTDSLRCFFGYVCFWGAWGVEGWRPLSVRPQRYCDPASLVWSLRPCFDSPAQYRSSGSFISGTSASGQCQFRCLFHMFSFLVAD